MFFDAFERVKNIQQNFWIFTSNWTLVCEQFSHTLRTKQHVFLSFLRRVSPDSAFHCSRSSVELKSTRLCI